MLPRDDPCLVPLPAFSLKTGLEGFSGPRAIDRCDVGVAAGDVGAATRAGRERARPSLRTPNPIRRRVELLQRPGTQLRKAFLRRAKPLARVQDSTPRACADFIISLVSEPAIGDEHRIVEPAMWLGSQAGRSL